MPRSRLSSLGVLSGTQTLIVTGERPTVEGSLAQHLSAGEPDPSGERGVVEVGVRTEQSVLEPGGALEVGVFEGGSYLEEGFLEDRVVVER